MSQPPEKISLSDDRRGDVSNLRAERDRFVALAFCNADLLFELGASGDITFAFGATKAFTGREAVALKGARLKDFVHEADQRKLDRLLRDARAGSRIDDALITFGTPTGQSVVLNLSGFHMSDLGGHTYLSFRVKPAVTPLADENAVRVEGLEVYDKNSFAEIATRALSEVNAEGEECQLTMIELGRYDELRERLTEEAQSELTATMGSLFRNKTLNETLFFKIMERNVSQYHTVSTVQTLLYFPYNLANVHEGGDSILFDDPGFNRMLQVKTGADSKSEESQVDYVMDLEILEMIYSLPTLDPFLLKSKSEQLDLDGRIHPSYFNISEED